MDISREWYKNEFINHELLLPHTPIEEEFHEYIAIAEGDLDYVRKQNKESFIDQQGKGHLSDNKLQNIRYHFVVATALITRYCAMNGMELEKAYSLSDFYIQKMDKCTTIADIAALHNTMCLDFCNKMYVLKKSEVLSKPVVLCMNYIYSHLHTRITLKQLAEYTSLSENYLSKIFREEIGVPVSKYITLQKIEQARNLLSYSDYSLTAIANYLAFSSQSHFIQVFERYVGMTPHNYRNKYFRNSWDDMSPSPTK